MVFRFAFVLLLTAMGWAAELTLPDGLSYTAIPYDGGYEVQMVLPSVGKAEIEVYPFKADLKSAVSAVPTEAKTGEALLLCIRLQDSEALPIKPGTYRLLLAILTEAQKAAGGKPQLFVLSVQIPPVVIAPPPALELVMTAGCLGWDCGGPIPVTYRPADSKGRLTGVKVSQQLPLKQDGIPVSGSLKVDVKQEETEQIRFDISNGDQAEALGRGTFTGQLLITADQLAQPLTVAVKIVRRASLFYLLLFILAGFGAGHLLRTTNDGRIATLTLEIDAHRILDQITDLLSKNADPGMSTELRAIESEIKAKLGAQSIKPEDLPKFRERLSAAAKNLVEAGKALTDDASAALQLLGQRQLPSSLRNLVAATRESIEKAVVLDRNNVSEGRERLTAALAAFQAGVLREGAFWRREFSLNLRLWDALKPLLAVQDPFDPEASMAALKNAVKAVETLLANSSLSNEQAASVLESIHQIESMWPAVQLEFPGLWQRSVNEIYSELHSKKLDAGAEWRTQAIRIAGLLGGESSQQQAIQELQSSLISLRSYLRDRISAIPEPGRKSAAQSAFDQSKWLEVIRELDPGSGSASAPTPISELDLLTGQPAFLFDSSPVSPAPPWIAPPSVSITIANLQSELEKRITWRRIFAAALLSAAGFLALQSTYTGSNLDFLIAFSWAYSTDLLAANAIALVNSKFPK